MSTAQRALIKRVKDLNLSKEEKEELTKIILTVFEMIRDGEK